MSREKKYLLASALLMILYLVLDYFVLNDLMVDLLRKVYPTIEIEDTTMYSNIIAWIFYSIGIIYMLVLTLNKKIDLSYHKTGIIIWSIIFFLTNIISGIFGFITLGKIKGKKKEKRELPEIEDKEYTNKWICLFAFAICMVMMFVVSDHLEGLKGMLIVYGSIFILMISVFFKQLVHDFKIFKSYFKEYMSLVLKTWGLSLLVMLILSITIQIITGLNNSNNQESLQKMFDVYPILVGALAMFYAPFAEELMFRGVFKKFIKSKYLFIIVSGVMFGLLHVIDDSKTLAEFSYVIIYSALGMFLAKLYYKTNNLFTNITFHFLQNTLGVIGMILLHYFL